ncbi:MAG TPA: hypothetical protein VFZ65_23375 [Planctomycetota bacterium]|nr:hypothetical protein [Planctomycetota bacterium]
MAREDLRLDRAFVVHPGDDSYPLADWAEVVALRELRARLAGLGFV